MLLDTGFSMYCFHLSQFYLTFLLPVCPHTVYLNIKPVISEVPKDSSPVPGAQFSSGLYPLQFQMPTLKASSCYSFKLERIRKRFCKYLTMHRQQILLLKKQTRKMHNKTPNQPNKNPNQNPHIPVLKQMRISMGMGGSREEQKVISNFLQDFKKPHSYIKKKNPLEAGVSSYTQTEVTYCGSDSLKTMTDFKSENLSQKRNLKPVNNKPNAC